MKRLLRGRNWLKRPSVSVRRLRLEELESRALPSGPSVSSVTPLTVINQTFNYIDVQFNEAINPSTLTTSNVTIQGPTGAVAPTGVTELSGSLYQVSFAPLTTRGLYNAAIGPGVADTSGNVMNQAYDTTLEYVNAGVVFTSSTTISGSNGSYDGQDICIDGTTVTIDGTHSFDSIQIINGGVLTETANTTTQTYGLNLNVTNQVIVDSTSAINVTGDGYQAGRTTGNTTTGGATGSSGGSYGGLGGLNGGATNAVYGNYADPDDWGSGGARTSGGGLVQLVAGALQLNGQLLANGTTGNYGAGSGGSIYVAVQSLSGTGL
ncbi:MAG TPA: Ig-like domain-containing protein, partial [Gemmata sp.]|nr:Ig-like domain-containing protein [Gemmata sp.]